MKKETKQLIEKIKSDSRGWNEWKETEHKIEQIFNIPIKEINDKMEMKEFNQIMNGYEVYNKDYKILCNTMRMEMSKEIREQ